MKRIIGITVVLVALLPAALWAQGDLTLDGLAEQLAAVITRVDAVEERVTALEGDPAGFCSPSVKGYHPMTLAGIDKDSPGYEVELYPDISHVRLNAETGEIIVQWQSCCTEIVTEYYDSSCQWTGYKLK